MSDVGDGHESTIGLGLSKSGNRDLLAELFADHGIVDLADATTREADVCIVDERGLSRLGPTLAQWKRDQRPLFAPVLLLTETADPNPWETHGDVLGEQIDAIQPIPAPRTAIEARVESLIERRRYSQDLDHERQLNRQIFDTSPIGKLVLDTDRKILRANPRAADILGMSASSLTGRTYDDRDWTIIDDDGDRIPAAALPSKRVLSTGEPVYGFEHGIEHPDGERVWLSVNVGPIRDETGEIEFLVASIEEITERKRLERELKASEELHRVTLSNITDTVFLTDETGEFTYVCPNVHFIFGLTASEVRECGDVASLLGEDPIPAAFGPDDVAENIQLEVTDSAGESHTVLVTIKSVSIQQGTRLYSIRDVTQLVESRRQLDAERERLETVVSNAPLVLASIDADGILRVCTGRQLEQLDLEPGAGVGSSIYDVFADVPAMHDIADRLLAGEQFSTEVVIDGRVFRTWNQPVLEDGEIQQGIIVAQDITEERRQEERFRAFVEGSSDIISVLDDESRIQYVSPSVERILGYDPEALQGESVFSYVHRADVATLVGALDRLWEAREGTTITEVFRLQHADGSWRWVETRSTRRPVRTGDVVVNARDITARRRLEADLQDSIDQLEILDRVLRHNLRNDVNVIQSYAELLASEDAADPEHATHILQKADQIIERVNKEREITDLLAHPRSGQRVDLAASLRSRVEAVSDAYPDATVAVECPDSLAVWATTDIGRAFEELLRNAMVHNDRDQPRVSVSVSAGEDTVMVDIADEGPGLPAMERAMLTGEIGMSQLSHGGGLGLWLVHLVVEDSDGTVSVRDNDPRGTVVEITLGRAG